MNKKEKIKQLKLLKEIIVLTKALPARLAINYINEAIKAKKTKKLEELYIKIKKDIVQEEYIKKTSKKR